MTAAHESEFEDGEGASSFRKQKLGQIAQALFKHESALDGVNAVDNHARMRAQLEEAVTDCGCELRIDYGANVRVFLSMPSSSLDPDILSEEFISYGDTEVEALNRAIDKLSEIWVRQEVPEDIVSEEDLGTSSEGGRALEQYAPDLAKVWFVLMNDVRGPIDLDNPVIDKTDAGVTAMLKRFNDELSFYDMSLELYPEEAAEGKKGKYSVTLSRLVQGGGNHADKYHNIPLAWGSSRAEALGAALSVISSVVEESWRDVADIRLLTKDFFREAGADVPSLLRSLSAKLKVGDYPWTIREFNEILSEAGFASLSINEADSAHSLHLTKIGRRGTIVLASLESTDEKEKVKAAAKKILEFFNFS